MADCYRLLKTRNGEAWPEPLGAVQEGAQLIGARPRNPGRAQPIFGSRGHRGERLQVSLGVW